MRIVSSGDNGDDAVSLDWNTDTSSWPRIEELVAAEQLAENHQLNFGEFG